MPDNKREQGHFSHGMEKPAVDNTFRKPSSCLSLDSTLRARLTHQC